VKHKFRQLQKRLLLPLQFLKKILTKMVN